MKNDIRKVGLLTSGGDAPGMNACIRSVVRKAVYEKVEVQGVIRGFEGLIKGEMIPLSSRSVSNILSRGGTMLKTARSSEFMTEKGQKKAVNVIKENDIDALVVIGGNGSLQGANTLHEKWGIKNVGIPGTIDNDLGHTDYTIGCHTAVDTVLDAVDKIRDTVSSMERIYVIEVMGREEPYLAVNSGIAGGAEEVLFPGSDINMQEIVDDIKNSEEKGKRSWIIIVSEGYANAEDLSCVIAKMTGHEVRAVTLGHIQRGGKPDAPDRVLASRMGAFAVDALLEGSSGVMVGIKSNDLQLVSYKDACFERRQDQRLNTELYKLTKLLAK